MQDWTTTFFSQVALDAWRRAQSPEVTQAEVEFLEEALGLGAEPKRLLDVPCGDARHAVELARRGHRVTAIDSAQDNEAQAQVRSASAGVTIDFVRADMRALPKRAPFEGAYCWGNSFGYFPRSESQRFTTAVGKRLVAGSRFVIDTATSAESLLVELERQSWVRVDDELVLLLECEYDARESRLDTTYTSVLRDQVVDRRTAHHYVFTSGEIVGMLEAAGFEIVDLLEDLDGAQFQLGSERLLLVAELKE
jgi:SAM-dependent methyltransferase